MMQLIDKQKGKFCMIINGVECVFMPMELYTNKNFLPLKKILKGSTLGWYVGRKFVSYNQVRKLIKG